MPETKPDTSLRELTVPFGSLTTYIHADCAAEGCALATQIELQVYLVTSFVILEIAAASVSLLPFLNGPRPAPAPNEHRQARASSWPDSQAGIHFEQHAHGIHVLDCHTTSRSFTTALHLPTATPLLPSPFLLGPIRYHFNIFTTCTR